MNDSSKRRALRAVNPGEVKHGGHYSSAIIAGDFVFLSGQTPRDAERKVTGESIEEQAGATLDKIALVLAAAGAGMEDIVKITVYITDLTLFSRFNTLYASYFPLHKPARTTVEAGLQGVLVEIDAVAYVGNTTRSRCAGGNLETVEPCRVVHQNSMSCQIVRYPLR